MLAKISSGASGIREYLETGRKAGREYDRDLIDDRIPMDGDIDLMDDTINSIQTMQEGDARYLHISLSFAEKFTESENPGPGQINMAMMQKALQQYKNDLMAAYDPNEFVFYAEAHIPKVTHDIHAKTGEVIERLPHIHVVIPLRNIATDQYMNPLGYGEINIPFHDAIQEKINNDYGFKSPDDAPRQGKPEPGLDRHTDRPAPTTAKEIHATFYKAADQGQFKTLDDVAEFAKQFGDTRIRKGKNGDYVNVKPEWAAKGINLSQFTPEKLASINKSLEAKQDLAKERRIQKQIEDVEHWRERRSLEVRYVSSKGRRTAFKALDEKGKREWLEERRDQSRAALLRKLNEGIYGRTATTKDGRNQSDVGYADRAKSDDRQALHTDPFNAGKPRDENPTARSDLSGNSKVDSAGSARNSRTTKNDLGEISHDTNRYRGYKPRVAKVGRLPPPQRIHRLSNLSELGVVRIEDEPEMLLQGDVPGNVGIEQAAITIGLRRLGDRPGTGGIDLEQTELAARIQQIGTRQATCLSLLQQSGAALKSLDGLQLNVDAVSLATRGIQSTLAADVQRLSETEKNPERQKSVIQGLKPNNKSFTPDQRLKANTSPALVLEAAQKLYGINPDDYAIGAGKDGTPRIFHDNKQYNLGDFFTKHLGKTWEEARPVLVDCYHASLSDALPAPDQALWLTFNEWRSQSFLHRNAAKETLRESLRKETLATREHFKAQKTAAYQVKGQERHTLLAEARANRLDAMERIATARKKGNEELKAPGRNAEYRMFLTSLAENGDLVALAELRRIAKILPEKKNHDFINGAKSKTTLPLPNYSIDAKGDVIYKEKGIAVVKDSRDGVQVLNAEERAYDLALKVAVSRYGTTLTLNGDQLFKQQMLDAAKRSGMKLTLRDSDSMLKTPIRVNQDKDMER